MELPNAHPHTYEDTHTHLHTPKKKVEKVQKETGKSKRDWGQGRKKEKRK